MKGLGSRPSTVAFAAVVMLSGCAGQIPRTEPLAASGRVAEHRSSWMSPAAAGKNLLYVSQHQQVHVYDYGTDNEVGELDGFTDAAGSCTDAKGDVYVTNYGAADILEFARGNSNPIKTLIDPSPYPTDCSIDAKTGDLAVINQYGESEYAPGNVLIYSDAKGKPKKYTVSGFSTYLSGTYDAQGDLLVSDITASADAFAMLPHGSAKFEAITLPHSSQWERPGFVRWDGAYFDVEFSFEGVIFVWYTVKGSKGTQEGFTSTEESGEVGGPFWLGRIGAKKSIKRANQLVVGVENSPVRGWDYPRGGDYLFQLYDEQRAGGVTVSPAP